MSFADDLDANAGNRRTICGVSLALQKLGAKDRKDLLAALANEAYTSAAIGRTLRSEKYGLNVSDLTVNRHRRSTCACD